MLSLVALVNGDNDGILGVVVLMVLHIAAGLVSALLSISRLTLTGQRFSDSQSSKLKAQSSKLKGGTWKNTKLKLRKLKIRRKKKKLKLHVLIKDHRTHVGPAELELRLKDKTIFRSFTNIE